MSFFDRVSNVMIKAYREDTLCDGLFHCGECKRLTDEFERFAGKKMIHKAFAARHFILNFAEYLFQAFQGCNEDVSREFFALELVIFLYVGHDMSNGDFKLLFLGSRQ